MQLQFSINSDFENSPDMRREDVLDLDCDGAFVGSIKYGANHTDPGEGAEIEIHISEQYRGQNGAARPVMRHIVDSLTKQGFRQAFLYVKKENGHARDFFKRDGWTEEGVPSNERMRDHFVRFAKRLAM